MIHLIVGNTGSGKTTYAQLLKSKGNGVIFSIDRWNNILFMPDRNETDGLVWFLERIDRAEQIIMELILQLEASKLDVILDLGFSKQVHREKFRKFAVTNKLATTTHFLDIPKKIRKERVINRNHDKGSTYEFEVSEDNFNFMETWFEKPSPEEMIGEIIINS